MAVNAAIRPLRDGPARTISRGDLLVESPIRMLWFPREGVRLAMDLAMEGVRTLRLLDRLDETAVAAGRMVYPAKDARRSGRNFRRFFPAFVPFFWHVGPFVDSSSWRRVSGGP